MLFVVGARIGWASRPRPAPITLEGVILGIDTSIGTAVTVIEPDGVVRAQLDSGDPRGHAEVIGDHVARVLAESEITSADVTHVAAGMGPGPFTGLRVGIAAARAFALGRGIPLIPVVSHDAVALDRMLMAAMTGADEERFAVVTEFAFTVYEGLDDDGLPVRVADPALAPRDELDAALAAHGARRLDAGSVPAAMLALAAGRAVAAGRRIAADDALYLRSPDVTAPTAPKRVIA